MAFDEELAMRVRAALGDAPIVEQKMFGGITFMLNGHMTCGVIKDRLVLRLGDAFEEALQKPHTEPMTFTGVPLKGMIYVLPAGVRTPKSLAAWVSRAVEHARSLPPKKPKKKAARK